ncbi:MAG: SUMF1/EgtB/PvdO family nonheme iron enzyme [Blastocatellia bacterium]|nr:SUMF1/EgtB/PvdO family nonheme iron enzyme [Blastocatellia bacterium]
MTFCTNCGKRLTTGATQCDACGATKISTRETPLETPQSSTSASSEELKTRIAPGTGGAEFSTISGATLPLQAIGAQVGRVLGGRYQLDQVIGSGGMGEIYRARRLHIGDTVAVKILRADVVENEKSRQRFYREARAAAMLHHPNAVVIHDFGEDTDGTAYIVMELLLGRSLRQLLIDDGTVSSPRCYGIIRQACAALDAGHRNGIIHRDIKPDNIILLDSNDGADHVKILDFGIAKLRDQALDTLSMEQRLTNVGTVIGTPHYMAPEQCQGEEADARSDIYSLGVVLYELLTGVAPFLAKTPTGVAIKHVTEKPRPLRELQPSVSESVERVVLRALEKEPSARQQTALELAREFEAAVRSEVGSELLSRSGEQPQVDSDTMRLAKESKTEVISRPQETGANRVASPSPESFDTMVSPASTEQFRDPSTGLVSSPHQTMEQRPPRDELRTQAIPPTEVLPPSPPAEAPKQEPPAPKTAAKTDALRTDPFAPEPPAATPPAAKPEKKAEKPKEPRESREKAKEKKSEARIESPKPAPAPAPPARPAAPAAAASSRMPLIAGGAVGVVILAALGWWMLGGSGDKQEAQATATPAAVASAAASPVATSAYPEQAAPEGMVYVLGGAFRAGRDDGEPNERPAHTVTIKPFFIDRTEVTNEEYQKYIDATGSPAPPAWNDNRFPENAEKLPVTGISWEEATAYAEWAGKRLPTEEEWEFAARGADGRFYPWGENWMPDTANVKNTEGETRELMPVGQFVLGASPFGVVDMSGNVWEWTASDYREYPGGSIEAPPAGFTNLKVIRGGSYLSSGKKATATLRVGWPGSRDSWPKGRAPEYDQTGFRCAQDVK